MPESDLVTIGEVLAPWGTRGGVKVRVLTDFPERFAPSAEVLVGGRATTIESVERLSGAVALKLRGTDTLADAQKLRGKPVEIDRGQLKPLPEGQYYHFDLVGLEVRTTQGTVLGTITGIVSGPANDAWVVRTAEGEVLVPAIEDVVKSVDLDKRRVIIEPMEGLLGPSGDETEEDAR